MAAQLSSPPPPWVAPQKIHCWKFRYLIKCIFLLSIAILSAPFCTNRDVPLRDFRFSQQWRCWIFKSSRVWRRVDWEINHRLEDHNAFRFSIKQYKGTAWPCLIMRPFVVINWGGILALRLFITVEACFDRLSQMTWPLLINKAKGHRRHNN
jgi:hypothetical protein